MPTEIKLPGLYFPDGEDLASEDIDLAIFETPGLRHHISARRAESDGATLSVEDSVTRALVQSFSTYTPTPAAPLVDTAINGKPTITLGAGTTVLYNGIRAVENGALAVDVDEFTIAGLVRVTGTNPQGNTLLGMVLGATTGAGNRSPNIRFSLGGVNQRVIQFLGNDLVPRSFTTSHEFQNLDRVFLVSFKAGDAWNFYVDDWETPARTDTANTEALTDGRFQIGTTGAGVTSQNFAGSFTDIIASDVALADNPAARKSLMEALRIYGGITL